MLDKLRSKLFEAALWKQVSTSFRDYCKVMDQLAAQLIGQWADFKILQRDDTNNERYGNQSYGRLQISN